MALVDLKSNLANFRSDFKPMDLETRFVNPNSSTINIDSIPESVSKKSKLAPFSRKLTSSLLNIDDIPNKFSPGEIYKPSRYNIAKIVNASRFNIDHSPAKFSSIGKYIPSKYEVESKLPDTITRWVGANGKAAEAVNYISDIKFGLRGFVTNFTDPNTSQFLGVVGSPLQNKFDYPATILGNRLMKPAQSAAFPGPQNFMYNEASKGFTTNLGKSGQAEKSQFLGIEGSQYTYPKVVLGNKLMKPSKSIAFPGPQNFIDDIKFGATGFTANLGKSGLAEKSQFLGIAGAPGNETYTYPGSKLLQGDRLMKPGLSSQQFDKKQYGIEQDFFNNKYASGFTTNMNLAPSLEKSQFKGINGTQFIVSSDLINSKLSVFKVLLNNSKFNTLGVAEINSKSNVASPFRFSSLDYGGGRNSTQGNATRAGIFKNYSSSHYETQVKVVNKQTFEGSKSSSPLADYSTSNKTSSGFSPLDHQYRKFNLRDESFNPFYIESPYILRGIQRRKNEKPQRWGFGDTIAGQISSLLDIPRGGLLTTVDRVLSDTARIAKWMISPKGIAWVVKQLLLANLSGGSHSKRQRLGKISLGQIGDTGIPMIASVIGNALGLHVSRHGVPFLNQIGITSGPLTPISVNTSLNYGATPVTIGIFSDGPRIGNPDLVLLKTTTNLPKPFPNTIAQYQRVDNEVDHVRLNDRKNLKGIIKEYELQVGATVPTPGNDSQANIESSFKRQFVYPEIESGPGLAQQYFTMAYNRIPKDVDAKKFRDFRRDIKYNFGPGQESLSKISAKNILGTAVILNDKANEATLKPDYEVKDVPKDFVQHYEKDNLETRYGFGNQGDQSRDTTPMIGKGSFLVSGNQFDRNKTTHNDSGRKILARNSKFRGDKITAIDISSGTAELPRGNEYLGKSDTAGPVKDLIKFWFEDGVAGKNVMPFRCTITGLSDTFSPGWNTISIMGRPDGAALYTSFERSISFSFIAAATSRSEMIPMWRKLNYLASYTMPDYNKGGGKPSGPFMRLTIGDLYYKCAGYITSLSYTFPDEGSWDIAADFDPEKNPDAKQLPMSVEVSVSYTIINDYRPQMMGRVYSLSPYGTDSKSAAGQWLPDAEETKP
jgi:hypothetical protein